MKQIEYSYEKTSLISSEEIKQAGEQLKPEIERLKKALDTGYETWYASINVPGDNTMQETIKQMVEEKKSLKPTTLVVIGIGGSNLGTLAIHQALYGRFYNEQEPDVKVYFADTIDTDYIYDIILLVEQELEKGNNIILNVVTKSGTTTETITNFELFFFILEKAKKADYQKYIVVTTDEGSKLWDLAKKKGISCLAIPKKVGGRFSVLSAVGQFPLGLLGVNVPQLLKGAHSMLSPCSNTDIDNNPAAIRAAILATCYKKGINIHDTFLFSVDLEGLGRWYRQLMGESIGKMHSVTGEEVFVGISPTVSVGTYDLHSVGQLYLAGPYDKFSTFVSVEKNKSNVALPEIKDFDTLVANIQGKKLSSIMDAVLDGVKKAFYKGKRPFDSIVFPEKSPFIVGQYLQMHMIEMMYLGYLLNIDPFDQPEVELYKSETRKILAHG